MPAHRVGRHEAAQTRTKVAGSEVVQPALGIPFFAGEAVFLTQRVGVDLLFAVGVVLDVLLRWHRASRVGNHICRPDLVSEVVMHGTVALPHRYALAVEESV